MTRIKKRKVKAKAKAGCPIEAFGNDKGGGGNDGITEEDKMKVAGVSNNGIDDLSSSKCTYATSSEEHKIFILHRGRVQR